MTSYFNKTIGQGDYYTLDRARDIVQSKKYNKNKEDRLIHSLEMVSNFLSVHRTKSTLEGKELSTFMKSIDDLGDIGVNPVTIPRVHIIA